jgi:hypothetical protein
MFIGAQDENERPRHAPKAQCRGSAERSSAPARLTTHKSDMLISSHSEAYWQKDRILSHRPPHPSGNEIRPFF